jgi:thiamine pyrophosphate-dependent acetolactate synthase large subunit-like protein
VSVERPTGLPTGRAEPAFGSDLVVDLLHTLGYRYLPMNPGSSFRGLHDSVVNHGGNEMPQLLLCLHEEIAVAMAHGYAKARGGPAAAAVHDLVGLMHASMAVYDAFTDRAPLLLLGGSGPADPAARRPIDWLHSATTQAELVRQYVKWDDEPATPESFAHSVVRAHQLAHSAPPGPVYVSLDAGAQEQRLTGPVPLPDLSLHRSAPRLWPDPAEVESAARLLAGARLPVVVGGRVGLDPAATPLLRRLVEAIGAAYVDDRNLVAFPTAHPANCTGDARLLRDADVVLGVDVVDLPGLLADRGRGDRGAAATGAPLPAIIDLSAGDLAMRSWSNAFAAPLPRAVQLLADPLIGLEALVDALDGRRADDDVARSATEARSRRAAVHERAEAELRAHWSDTPIWPGRLVAETWAAVRDVDRLLTLRNTRSWPTGVWEFTGAGEYLGHSGGGGVGYGPGAMVGGALAARDRGQLGVAIVGDGDLLMASGALWTAVHYGIPMLVVVNDNSSFYNDEPHQAHVARHRGRPAENSWIGMRIGDPAIDIAGLAASYGCAAHGTVEDPEKLPAVLRDATADAMDGAVAVVHVRTARQ